MSAFEINEDYFLHLSRSIEDNTSASLMVTLFKVLTDWGTTASPEIPTVEKYGLKPLALSKLSVRITHLSITAPIHEQFVIRLFT